MIDTRLFEKIAVKDFDGVKREGPRRDFIHGELRKRGLSPYIDSYGNLWAETGKTGDYKLFSSHMDIDPETADAEKFRAGMTEEGLFYVGIMDNAAGCYLNLELAEPSDSRRLYVFTASEEENPEDDEIYGEGAQHVVKELKRTGIQPSLTVSIDATYPRLLYTAEYLDNAKAEDGTYMWDKLKPEEMMDMTDNTHCYVDGIEREDSEETARKLLEAYGNPGIKMRDFAGFGEASFYSQIAPSFEFGPVVYGKMNRPNQSMPQRNLETALGFLRFVSESWQSSDV